MSVPSNGEMVESARRRLTELRDALLRLHKALLESERTGYEKIFGQVGSSYQLLQLLTVDPWFAWLRPVSQLIAAMDETLDAKEPLTAARVNSLANQTKMLLTPSASGEGFAQHYDEALQRDPNVVFAHVETARWFRSPTANSKPVA